MDIAQENLKRRLPRQDLARLSFVAATPKKVHEWVAALPMVNVGESSRLIYQTIQEVNRLQIDERHRLEMLEALRPAIYFLCNALSKHYLNQPIVLPEKAAKVATLAQAMQNHLANGYKLVCLALAPFAEQNHDMQRLLGLALHRAMTDLTATLLRCLQLYIGAPGNMWLELHSLYLLASAHGLSLNKYKDPTHQILDTTSIQDAYIRALLLGTCRPNQLRQSDIASTYLASELWTGHIQLKPATDDSDLFVFNLFADAPPTYRVLAKKGEAAHMRAIASDALISHLQDLLADTQAGTNRGANGESALSPELLRHLIRSWGDLSERSFKRTALTGDISVCLGLTATHYYVAGLQDFETVLLGNNASFLSAIDENPFLQNKDPFRTKRSTGASIDDPWSAAFDVGGARMNQFGAPMKGIEFTSTSPSAERDTRPKYDSFTCAIVNTSPGGYCISWKGEVPSMVRTGEVIGVCEPNQTEWSVGVIRWIKHIPGEGAQLGIEVLAPKARPCGAKVLKKTGDHTEFMRALLLPELSAISKPATLITPNLTFKTGYKITLNLAGEELRAQLTRQVGASASFCQFEFLVSRKPGESGLGEDDENPPSSASTDDFDSIWSSL